MDLQSLKEQLGDEKFSELETYVNDLTGQRDAARKESAKGRHKLKARVAELETKKTELETAQSDLFERLGIESMDDVTELDPKGQAEAAKQFEAKLKRMEKDLGAKNSEYEDLFGKYRGSLQNAAMRKAMAEHEWIDSDLVESFVGGRLMWEEDEVLYKTDDGVAVPLSEGMQVLAKEKPHLLKAAGAGGSGYRGKPLNGDATQSMTRADFDALNPAGRMAHIKAGGQIVEE